MAIHFDPDIGAYADDAETVREQVKTVFVQAFASQGVLNTDPETPQGQLIDAITAMIVAKDNEILFLANQFNPQTASGVWQDALAKIYFVDRKIATKTIVTGTCKGLYGTVIPAGSIVQDADGNKYTANTEYTIGSDGKIDVQFECTETGAIACPAHSLEKIITVVSGWDSVDNTSAGVIGSVTEPQSKFEKRRWDTVANNAHGTAYALEGALLALEDVVDAVVLDNRQDASQTMSGITIPAHTVAICVYGADESEIAKTIYEKLDAGVGTTGSVEVSHKAEDGIVHKYNIVRPTPKNFYVNIKINFTASTPATIEEDIANAILKDFNGEGDNAPIGLSDTLYASRFAVPVIKDAGVVDLVSISVGFSSSPTGQSITFKADELPQLPKENITVDILRV